MKKERIFDDGVFRLAFVVCVLSDGNDDTGDLPNKASKGTDKLWKRKRSIARNVRRGIFWKGEMKDERLW